MKELRRLGRPAAGALLAAGLAATLLTSVAVVASHHSTVRVLGALPAFRDVLRPAVVTDSVVVPALREDFLARRLGADLALFRGGDEGPRSADRGRIGADPDGTVGPGPSPDDDASPDGTLLVPLPSFSELTVAVAADREAVEPGGFITYVITVTNVGTKDFQGELLIESHHPFWTTDATTQCGDSGVDLGDDPCVAPAVPVPGTPGNTTHTVRFSYHGPIAEDAAISRSFRVRVNPGTPSGTVIFNHAHVDVPGDGRDPHRSSDEEVVVR